MISSDTVSFFSSHSQIALFFAHLVRTVQSLGETKTKNKHKSNKSNKSNPPSVVSFEVSRDFCACEESFQQAPVGVAHACIGSLRRHRPFYSMHTGMLKYDDFATVAIQLFREEPLQTCNNKLCKSSLKASISST